LNRKDAKDSSKSLKDFTFFMSLQGVIKGKQNVIPAVAGMTFVGLSISLRFDSPSLRFSFCAVRYSAPTWR